MRTSVIGLYKERGLFYKLLEQEGYAPKFADVGINIRFKFAGGETMTKEEYKLFSNWIMQSGRTVIETNAQQKFEKGDKIKTRDGEYMINRVIVKMNARFNGLKKVRAIRSIIFCE